jgi:cytochrome c peroxidase
MHGNLATIQNVIGHYGTINKAAGNTNLDPRLTLMDLVKIKPAVEVNALTAFIQTLSGTNVYVDTKWSTPFK